MLIAKPVLESRMRTEYGKLTTIGSRVRNLMWPSALKVCEEDEKITLVIDQQAITSNMQSNESAFEGWILVLKELLYKRSVFSIELPKGRPHPNDKHYKHYQQFLFRLSVFDSLFGKKSAAQWLILSEDQDHLIKNCLYNEYREKNKLKSNVGIDGRGKGNNAKKLLSDLRESEIEWRLCKGNRDENCLNKFFHTGEIYRQFPIGMFYVDGNKTIRLFPGKKACIDLVADGDEDSFWIFELKRKGNIPLGIISELLFYTAIVRDMIAKHVETQTPFDKDCYDPKNLINKKIINACFLAPAFHPLLMDTIIVQLNNAFAKLRERDDNCSVIFHKAILGMDKGEKLIIC